jgi:hypothetical protein
MTPEQRCPVDTTRDETPGRFCADLGVSIGKLGTRFGRSFLYVYPLAKGGKDTKVTDFIWSY